MMVSDYSEFVELSLRPSVPNLSKLVLEEADGHLMLELKVWFVTVLERFWKNPCEYSLFSLLNLTTQELSMIDAKFARIGLRVGCFSCCFTLIRVC